MSEEELKTRPARRGHAPLLPSGEVRSNAQAVAAFVPLALLYLTRHLSVGTFIRLRRIVLRRSGRVYYL